MSENKTVFKTTESLKIYNKKNKNKTRTALGMPKEEWNVFHIAGQCTD